MVDCEGFSFKHIRNIGIEQVKCMTSFMSGSFPLWVRRIHIVNNPRVFSLLYNMMKPFLDDRVRDNMVFHGYDYTAVQKEVPTFLLPNSMGGPGELDNEACVRVVMERTKHYEEILEKTLKQAAAASS